MADKNYFAKKMAERLPKALRDGANIRKLLETLGEEMSLMFDGAKLLSRSRWIHMARGWSHPEVDQTEKKNSELGRIADLFGLLPGNKESAEGFRFRLLEFIDIHEKGLGTVPSLLRLAALAYRAENRPEIRWEGDVAAASFRVTGENGEKRDFTITLEDNPVERRKTTLKGVSENEERQIINYSLTPDIPEIRFVASAGNIVFPMLIHRESGMRILYAGHIFEGEELRLENGEEPLRIGRNGSPQMDGFRFDDKSAVFDTPEGEEGTKFGGPALLLIGAGARFNSRQTFFDTEKGKFGVRFSGFDANSDLPDLKPGVNHFTYKTIDKQELESYIEDFENKETLLQNVSDEKGQNYPLDISFAWKAKVPCRFTLRVPGEYVPHFMSGAEELQRTLRNMMKYAAAAGITSQVDFVYSFEEKLETADSLKSKANFESRSSKESLKLSDSLGVGVSSLISENLGVSDSLKSSLDIHGSLTEEDLNASDFLNASIQGTLFKENMEASDSMEPSIAMSGDAADPSNHKFDSAKFDRSIFQSNLE